MLSDKRKSGIPLVGDLPWGTHFCQLYQTNKDILDMLVPYFKAGLQNNESCVWVTSRMLGAEEAKKALKKAIPSFEKYMKNGQIEVMPFNRWCSGSRKSCTIVTKLDKAILQGFDGLRLACNALPKNKGRKPGMCSRLGEIDRYNVIAVFAYPRDKFDAMGVMEVVKNHRFALLRNAKKWEVIEGSEGRILKDALKRSEEQFQSLFSNMSEGFAYHRIVLDGEGKPCDYVFLDVNEAFERLTGLKRKNIIGKRVTEAIPGINRDVTDWIRKYGKVALTGKPIQFESYSEPLGKWYSISAFSQHKGYFAVTFADITGRKQAEQELQAAHERLQLQNAELLAANKKLDLQAEELQAANEELSAQTEELAAQTEELQTANEDLRDGEEALRKSLAALRQSEEQFRRAILAAPIPVIMQAEDGQVLQISNTWSALTGYTLKDMATFDAWSKCAYGFGSDEMSEQMRRLFRGETRLVRVDFEIITRSGEGRIWSLSASSPGTLADGRRFIVGMALDITERRHAAERAIRAKEEWERTFDSVPDMIAILDNQHRIVRVNKAMAERFGLRPEECSGLPCYKIVHGTSAPPRFCPHSRTLQDGCEHVEEVREERLGGDFIVTTTPLLGDSGQLMGSVHVARDITERKRAEEDLRKLTEDLKRSNADLQQFAYIASHDLQSPLRTVEGFVKMLSRRYKGQLDEQADEFIQYISTGVKDMQALILDILEYSKVGNSDKAFSKIDTSVCVSKALSNLTTAIAEKNADITADESFPVISGDSAQLTSIFQNLIGNALKFCTEAPKIHISAESKDQEYIFSVRDNGIGMDPGDSDKVFALFHRLHGKDEYPGTGIGLAICKKIIERHGGRIWVESEPGKGSTFYFAMPAQ